MVKHSWKRWLGLAALVCMPAAQSEIRVTSQRVPGISDAADRGVVVADFEGIGRDDAAVTGLQQAHYINSNGNEPQSGFVEILRYDTSQNTYAIAQTLITGDTLLVGIAADPTASSAPGLVTVANDGMLTRYAGWPLQLVSRMPLGRAVSSMRVGDVDGDGQIEVVVADPIAGLAAYDLVTGALKRTYDGRTTDSIELAQLDSDPALEIIVTGDPGYVVDGALNTTDWEYAGGIGSFVAAGRILPGGETGFVAGTAGFGYMSVYRGSPYSPVWSIDDANTRGLDLVSVDGTGAQQIALSSYANGLFIIDPLTQIPLYTIADLPSGHIGAGRLQGGTSSQLVYGNGSLTIRSLADDTVFEMPTEYGLFGTSPAQDIDGDGVADGVWISAASDDSFHAQNGGIVHAYDPSTGAEKWATPLTDDSGSLLPFRQLSTVTLVPSLVAGRYDIAVGAAYYYTPELYVVDGQTRRIRLLNQQIGFQNEKIVRVTSVPGVTAANILAAASGNSIELGLFDGTDLQPIWHRILDTAAGTTLNDLQLASLEGVGSNDALLATSTSLVAYDLDTQTVLWSQATPTVSASTVALANGTQVLGALGADAHLRLLSLDGQTELSDFTVGNSEPQAVAALPNMPGTALVCVDRRINLVDLDAAIVIESSPWIGVLGCALGNIGVTGIANSNVSHIVAGSVVGTFDLIVAGDAIFSDGFE